MPCTVLQTLANTRIPVKISDTIRCQLTDEMGEIGIA